MPGLLLTRHPRLLYLFPAPEVVIRDQPLLLGQSQLEQPTPVDLLRAEALTGPERQVEVGPLLDILGPVTGAGSGYWVCSNDKKSSRAFSIFALSKFDNSMTFWKIWMTSPEESPTDSISSQMPR